MTARQNATGRALRRWRLSHGAAACVASALLLAGCAQGIPPHMKPVPKEAMRLMAKKDMRQSDPIFIRIFKKEAELEVWKQRADGRFHHFKTYPICNYSGALGPKLKQGDRQSPEGFYTVGRGQLNPNSKYHLAFNLGFPNRFDKSHGYTGNYLMVHGDCTSAGCYAMTDALIEELYALVRDALGGGQKQFHVHAFPFRMTDENFQKYRNHRWAGFWAQLKPGYEHFELTRQVPKVDVCARRYLVNAKFRGGSRKLKADGACPPYTKIKPELWAGIGGGHDRDGLTSAFETVTTRGIGAQSLRPRARRPERSAVLGGQRGE
ncbi:MAG: murein L,D-transpeptidase family protein [Pseudomonadota bacterium]